MINLCNCLVELTMTLILKVDSSSIEVYKLYILVMSYFVYQKLYTVLNVDDIVDTMTLLKRE